MPEAEAIVAELMPLHPEPGNARKAVAVAHKLLTTRPQAMAATIQALRDSHASWRLRWAEYKPGRFIPQLWRWIQDGDWVTSPVARKDAKSEKGPYDEAYEMFARDGRWDKLLMYGGPEVVEVWRAKIAAA